MEASARAKVEVGRIVSIGGEGRSEGAKAFQGLGLLLRVVRDLGEAWFAYRSAAWRISPGSRPLISWAPWQPPPPLLPSGCLAPASGMAGSRCLVAPGCNGPAPGPLLGAPVV